MNLNFLLSLSFLLLFSSNYPISVDGLHKISNIIGNYDAFIAKILNKLAILNIDVTNFEMDHICYRCESKQQYTEIISMLIPEYASLLTETIIGGRPISTLLLEEPLQSHNYSIECLEIPAPKDGSFYFSGLEHAEFVIGNLGDPFIGPESTIILENFMNYYYPLLPAGVKFDTRAMEKDINADVSLDLSNIRSDLEEETNDRRALTVKFHIRPLKEVVEYEIKQEQDIRDL